MQVVSLDDGIKSMEKNENPVPFLPCTVVPVLVSCPSIRNPGVHSGGVLVPNRFLEVEGGRTWRFAQVRTGGEEGSTGLLTGEKV